MNVIIIEDEKPSARRLQRMLKTIGINAEIMLHSVEEAVNWFQNNTFARSFYVPYKSIFFK